MDDFLRAIVGRLWNTELQQEVNTRYSNVVVSTEGKLVDDNFVNGRVTVLVEERVVHGVSQETQE